MGYSCASVCFGIYLTISSVLYVGGLVFNGILVHQIYFSTELRPWFVPYIALLLLPMVVVQLVSAILLMMKRGDNLSMCSSAWIAILHIFQVGFLWRHFSLVSEADPVAKSRDLKGLNILQTLHTFTSMLPLLCIQSYLILNNHVFDWITIVTVCVTLVGSGWCLASFRRHHVDNEALILTWPGTVFRFTWRCGELTSRVISLSVFASMYSYWIFMIIGLHSITMLVCLCTSVLGMFEKPEVSKSYKALMGIIVAYMYSFCFINFSSNTTTFRYTFFYIVMFLENVVLTTVWYLQINKSGITDDHTLTIFISGIAFFVGVLSMIMYYKCFHISASMDFEKQHICETDGCINCRLSVCSKHNIKLQRPFSAGWLSQYQQALVNGNYYKNIMQDTMIDSEWESTSIPDALNSSGEHWQIRDTDLESIKTCEKQKHVTSVQASGTYTHKRFFKTNPSAAADNDSISSGSGIYDEDWRQRPDVVMTQLSVHDSISMPSSRTQLLTDSWDNQGNQHSECVSKDPKHPKRMDILNSLIKKDLDTSFFSDGYTTDHTLDSYQLPVTVLAKKRARLLYRKDISDRDYSVASDSTDCTICAFMKQVPSSPDESRRNMRIHENIPEEPVIEKKTVKRDTRRQNDTKNKRYRKRPTKSPPKRSDQNKTNVTYNTIVNANMTSAAKLSRNLNGDYNTSMKPTSAFTPVIKSQSNRSKYRKPPLPSYETVITSFSLDSVKYVNNDKPTNGAKFMPNSYDQGVVSDRKLSLTGNSESGDSAFPRHTPLNSYLAATDDDQDGLSESSYEMII